MSGKRPQNEQEIIVGERRGMPIYKANPSLSEVGTRPKSAPTRIISGQRAMLVGEAGEVTGEGSVAFIERQEVDPEKFVKIYLAGLDGMFQLKKAGQRVFKLLWIQVQSNPNRDRVELNHLIAGDYGDNITERVFQRGVKELLDKGFIFQSTSSGMYFFNVQFIFNGNRILTAKEYVLKGSAEQQTLNFESEEKEEHS